MPENALLQCYFAEFSKLLFFQNSFGISLKTYTPFENPQRWMGQNTFPILLLNDDNMIGEH